MTNNVSRKGRPKSIKPIDKRIGERIKQARSDKGYSIRQLAREMETMGNYWSYSAIGKWERGEILPNDDALRDIALACGVSFEWLKGIEILQIIKDSEDILKAFNPIEMHMNRAWKNAVNSIDWHNISLSLGDCEKLGDYMETSIRNSLEFYINNILPATNDLKGTTYYHKEKKEKTNE